ncbi:MAG: hypothetical protein II112_02005, partial [Bacteroidales bacterium]|nr:hypothetical protein [Bacteroidales bacterium]
TFICTEIGFSYIESQIYNEIQFGNRDYGKKVIKRGLLINACGFLLQFTQNALPLREIPAMARKKDIRITHSIYVETAR